MPSTSPYDDAADQMLVNIQERTGKTASQWAAAIAEAGLDPLDQAAVRKWLKTEHGLGQNTQWGLAMYAAREAGWRPPDLEEWLAQQYSGAKAGLRPIYERVAEAAVALGPDVRIEGRKSYVPFIRARQFAAIAPATKARVDLGLRFTEAPSDRRLQAGGSGLGQSTHKVGLTSVDEVDADVLAWLRQAYDQNG
jgi:predicted transport protein